MENYENTKEENMESNQINNKTNVRKSKKKRHRFLKILLVIILLFIAFKVVRHIGNSIAEKKLNSFMVDYPFIFSNEDNYKAITEDFKVKNVFKLDDKEYKVTWSSPNNYIKFNEDNAIVNNTTSKNQKVEIKANYSILGGIGKASKTFDVTVLTKNKIAIEDVNVVKVNSVKDKSYNRNMKMTLTSKGDVAFMYGDFKQSIYTVDDCYTVLKAYQSNLKINTSCDFNFCDVTYGSDSTTYIFYLTINNYNIEDKKVFVSVDNNDNYSIRSIKCNFDKDISKYPIAKPQSDTAIYNLLSTTYNRTKDNTIFSYKSYGYMTIDNNIYLVGDYYLLYDNGEIHEIYVDIINGEIIKEVDSSKNIMEQCKGIGVMNDTKTFDAYKYEDKYYLSYSSDTYNFGGLENAYYLSDTERKIQTFNTSSSYFLYKLGMENMQWYYEYKDSENPFVQIGVVFGFLVNYGMTEADTYVSTYLTSSLVKSYTNEFNNEPTAVDGYYNIIKAYDYYKDHFNLISYDNQGSIINLYVENKMQKDNAAWYNDLKSFFINPVEDFKYSFAKDSEVLGHEYTHGVFNGYISRGGEEISGLNEAYADIFGIFIKGYTDWKIGENEYKGVKCYVRDLTNINSSDSLNVAVRKKPVPEKYHDADWKAWDGEEHAIACMIGHIAYQMYDSGAFTNTELENIWYKSLTYGYGGNDTYVTCRQQILQAMNDLNGSTVNGHKFSFSPEQRDLVRSFFDEAEIFDNTDTYECTSDAIEGDLLKDDSDVHRFAIVVSPIALVLNKSSFYIYEECESPSKSDEKIVQDELNKYWNSIGGNDVSNQMAEYVGSRDGDAVIYKQILPWQMNVLEWWIGKTNGGIDQFLEKTLNDSDDSGTGENADLINIVKKLIFTGEVDESTRYKFYDDMFN